MDARGADDAKRPCSPFEYLGQAVLRKAPQRFFVMGQFAKQDAQYPLSNPIAAIVQERETHTRAERREFLNNIVSMLELMEAQRDVDSH
jgi:hypothetical protein